MGLARSLGADFAASLGSFFAPVRRFCSISRPQCIAHPARTSAAGGYEVPPELARLANRPLGAAHGRGARVRGGKAGCWGILLNARYLPPRALILRCVAGPCERTWGGVVSLEPPSPTPECIYERAPLGRKLRGAFGARDSGARVRAMGVVRGARLCSVARLRSCRGASLPPQLLSRPQCIDGRAPLGVTRCLRRSADSSIARAGRLMGVGCSAWLRSGCATRGSALDRAARARRPQHIWAARVEKGKQGRTRDTARTAGCSSSGSDLSAGHRCPPPHERRRGRAWNANLLVGLGSRHSG